jgi:hypothetical protein
LLNLRSAALSCGLVLKMHSPPWRFIKGHAFHLSRQGTDGSMLSHLHDFSCALLLS